MLMIVNSGESAEVSGDPTATGAEIASALSSTPIEMSVE
jgi:hypothetical protein